MMSRISGTRLAVVVAASLALSAAAGRARAADGAAMTCPQIIDQISTQNATIKEKKEDEAQLQNARPDPGARDPEIQERLDDIAAGKATTRANALLATGREKKCFR